MHWNNLTSKSACQAAWNVFDQTSEVITALSGWLWRLSSSAAVSWPRWHPRWAGAWSGSADESPRSPAPSEGPEMPASSSVPPRSTSASTETHTTTIRAESTAHKPKMSWKFFCTTFNSKPLKTATTYTVPVRMQSRQWMKKTTWSCVDKSKRCRLDGQKQLDPGHRSQNSCCPKHQCHSNFTPSATSSVNLGHGLVFYYISLCGFLAAPTSTVCGYLLPWSMGGKNNSDLGIFVLSDESWPFRLRRSRLNSHSARVSGKRHTLH